MCRCLMAISAVSQHGPNPQAGPRRPDRSVSLPDPRETAAEMMGGLGNLPLKRLQKQRDDLIDRYERLKPDSPDAPFNQELDELLEAIDEVERQIRELDPPPPPPPVEAFDLDDPAARKAALAKWGAPHLGAVPDLPPGTHAMTGTGGHLPGGGGFDFDEFDRAVSEGVSAAEQNPWDLVEDPRTGELVERSNLTRSVIQRHVSGELAAPAVDWGNIDSVEAMFDSVMGELLGEDVGSGGHTLWEGPLTDEVWTEIIAAAERDGFEYDDGERGSWTERDNPSFQRFRPFESRAVNLPSGLPGFQSPSVSPGSPGFQAPPVRERPGGFRTPAVVEKPGGFQGAPPSVQSMLTHMASGEPGRIGRSAPEGPTPPYEPAPPLTEEERKRGKKEIEKIRKEHGLNMEMNQAIQAAIVAAAAGGALRTFGGGGILGGLGGGMSLR